LYYPVLNGNGDKACVIRIGDRAQVLRDISKPIASAMDPDQHGQSLNTRRLCQEIAAQ
jgi:hypothetical protein